MNEAEELSLLDVHVYVHVQQVELEVGHCVSNYA